MRVMADERVLLRLEHFLGEGELIPALSPSFVDIFLELTELTTTISSKSVEVA